jgi:hypothetical protein
VNGVHDVTEVKIQNLNGSSNDAYYAKRLGRTGAKVEVDG